MVAMAAPIKLKGERSGNEKRKVCSRFLDDEVVGLL